MIKPSLAELSQNNKYNRYTLVMATAKGARYIIDKENYEKEHPEIEQMHALSAKEEKTDDKPVKEAIDMLYNGRMFIKFPEDEKEKGEGN
jgi:DNA-directed RNA polymerase subunit K/omega